MGFLIIIVVAFAVMWLLVIMPQRRRLAAQRQTIQSLEVGAEVLTAGGLYGRVSAIGEDEISLEVAPGVDVRLAKRAIAGVLEAEEAREAGERGGLEELEPPGREADSGRDREG